MLQNVISRTRIIRQKALVVDDSALMRNVISKMFKQLNYIVSTAEDGQKGLLAAIEEKPDIITSDYDMPVMNGWDFCKNLKSRDDLKEIPIIMITTRKSDVDVKKGKLLGVSDYLSKPFTTEKLSEVIKRVSKEASHKQEIAELQKYVSVDTIQNISDVVGGVKEQQPESKFISILFSDICSFTPLCEKLTPKKIVKLLNSYFDVMVQVLHENNAIVDKFIGDAIVVRFDSGNKEEDALNAAKSALGMIEALKVFNEDSFEEINMRIGVNSGEVILGNLGCTKYRIEYAMIGDNVNVTQRLESQAPRQGCLISDTCYQLIKDKVVVDESVDFTLKGKSEKVKGHPLLKVI